MSFLPGLVRRRLDRLFQFSVKLLVATDSTVVVVVVVVDDDAFDDEEDITSLFGAETSET
jgi:hypothetical protein